MGNGHGSRPARALELRRWRFRSMAALRGSYAQITVFRNGRPRGEFLVIPMEAPSRTSPGRSLAIPVGPGETLPELPPEGLDLAKAGVCRELQSIARGELIPGKDPAHFAYVNTTVHRNLYRISLP